MSSIIFSFSELLGVAASSSAGYDSGATDEEDDDVSCGSGPVSEDEDLSSDGESQDTCR